MDDVGSGEDCGAIDCVYGSSFENTNATCIYLSSSRVDSFEEMFRGCFINDLGVIDDAGSFDGVLVGFSVKNTTTSRREKYNVTA